VAQTSSYATAHKGVIAQQRHTSTGATFVGQTARDCGSFRPIRSAKHNILRRGSSERQLGTNELVSQVFDLGLNAANNTLQTRNGQWSNSILTNSPHPESTQPVSSVYGQSIELKTTCVKISTNENIDCCFLFTITVVLLQNRTSDVSQLIDPKSTSLTFCLNWRLPSWCPSLSFFRMFPERRGGWHLRRTFYFCALSCWQDSVSLAGSLIRKLISRKAIPSLPQSNI